MKLKSLKALRKPLSNRSLRNDLLENLGRRPRKTRRQPYLSESYLYESYRSRPLKEYWDDGWREYHYDEREAKELVTVSNVLKSMKKETDNFLENILGYKKGEDYVPEVWKKIFQPVADIVLKKDELYNLSRKGSPLILDEQYVLEDGVAFEAFLKECEKYIQAFRKLKLAVVVGGDLRNSYGQEQYVTITDLNASLHVEHWDTATYECYRLRDELEDTTTRIIKAAKEAKEKYLDRLVQAKRGGAKLYFSQKYHRSLDGFFDTLENKLKRDVVNSFQFIANNVASIYMAIRDYH